MDPFEDFEFKPLTEGLGFNKTVEKPKSSESFELNTAAPASSKASAKTDSSFALSTETENELLGRDSNRTNSKSISDLIASLPPSLDFVSDKEETPRPQIFQPFAREEYKSSSASPTMSSTSTISGTLSGVSNPSGPTIGQVLPMPGSKVSTPLSSPSANAAIPAPTGFREKLDESYSRAFPQPKVERRKSVIVSEQGQLIEVPTHFGASILDGMVVSGMTMILLVCILMITKVNLVGLLSNAQTDVPTQFHLALLFLSVLQLYMLTARSFFGATLGEWAFDLQLGGSYDQSRAIYPILAAWRMLLVTATGVVVIPVLSLIFKRDLASGLTGLQLYRRP